MSEMAATGKAWALLVIDMQRDFCAPGGYAERAGMAISRLRAPIPNIAALLAAARAQGICVIHTREGHLSDLSDCPPSKFARSVVTGAPIGSPGPMGRLLVRGEYGHDFIDELQPQPGDVVVDKPGYSAFHQTELQSLLWQRGVSQLVITGVTTEVCVHSTLRAAIDRGYECITVADACATDDPALHAAALDMVRSEGNIFGRVCATAEVLQLWRDAANLNTAEVTA